MDTPIEKVHDLLNRPRSSADFSPAARYAVQRLADYAACGAEISAREPKRNAKCTASTTGETGGTEPEKTASCVKLQRMDGYYLVEVDGNPHRFTLWETAMQFIHDQTAEERKKKT